MLSCLLAGLNGMPQSYSFVHYDVKDGLPSKRIYAITQDQDGFLWIATDNGVCRFDGTAFRTYTTEDGMVDNDVINIFCDSKNRVWFAPFKKDVCYYYKGKIYTRQNDTLLRKLQLPTGPVKFVEDSENNLWLTLENGLLSVSPDNRVTTHFDPAHPVRYGCGIAGIWADPVAGVRLLICNYINNPKFLDCYQYSFHHGYLGAVDSFTSHAFAGRNQIFFDNDLSVYPDQQGQFAFRTGKTVIPSNLLNFSSLNTISADPAGNIALCTGDGVYLCDRKGKLLEKLLDGKTIGRMFVDAEGNRWFSSLDDGIYKLGPDRVRLIKFEGPYPGNEEVYSIARFGKLLVAGLNTGIVATIRDDKVTGYISKELHPVKRFDRSMQLVPMESGNLACRSDKSLTIFDQQLRIVAIDRSPYKCISVYNDTIYAGTTENARVLSPINFEQLRILLPERTAAILVTGDSTYIGTLDDLKIITGKGIVSSLGEIYPELKTKITTLDQLPEGTVWVGTYSSGVFVLRNGKLIRTINTSSGLTGNNCRISHTSGNTIWIGTDRGLNKIARYGPDYVVTRFTTSDGLPEDIINAVYSDSGRVYVGTASGLSWFDENRLSSNTSCNLLLEEVMADGKTLPLHDAYRFKFNQANISFAFTAISLKAAGNMQYTYRLNGLSNYWQQTSQSTLNFISLPAGNYSLEIYATNKAGVRSNVITIPFVIPRPFWKTDWFWGMMAVALVGLAWFITTLRIRSIKRKEAEKTKIRQQISELEQKAKRAQMNPHFIFNCISSIQSFIFSNQLEACNDYLARFARLIRQTLDNSDRTAIQLSEEVKYLDTYLSLEQMRFTGKFRYEIAVSPDIFPEFVYIPAMLLQPYVENSIRHGVRNRRDNLGLIRVRFFKEGNALICTVEDNGIGRAKAESLKSVSHIEYQSRGMSLTDERIHAINQTYGEEINVSIADLADETGEASGTRIIIRFPLTLLEKLK